MNDDEDDDDRHNIQTVTLYLDVGPLTRGPLPAHEGLDVKRQDLRATTEAEFNAALELLLIEAKDLFFVRDAKSGALH